MQKLLVSHVSCPSDTIYNMKGTFAVGSLYGDDYINKCLNRNSKEFTPLEYSTISTAAGGSFNSQGVSPLYISVATTLNHAINGTELRDYVAYSFLILRSGQIIDTNSAYKAMINGKRAIDIIYEQPPSECRRK